MSLAHLYRHTMASFRPPKRMSVSEWADAFRIVGSESASEPGPWRTSRAPYQRGPMEAFTQPGVEKIVMMFGAQLGKTEIELNMMGRSIDLDPGPMLFVQPTDTFARDFSQRRAAPMIRACRPLAEKVADSRSRDSGNTIGMKMFPGGSVTFTGANSPTELAGRPIRYVFMDEVDRFPKSAGSEGDPVKLTEQRTANFRNRKIVMTSTPTLKSQQDVSATSRIYREYLKGTQEEWQVRCPRCGAYSALHFDDIKFDKTISDAGGDQRLQCTWVKWRCPNCREMVEEYELKRSGGRWEARRPEALESGVRSFHINSFCSPWSDWKALVQEFLDARSDPQQLQVFWNTKLGLPWEVRDHSGRPEKLYARREHYNAEIPDGVLVLTMGIDTQDNRLEFEVVGWGRDEESWGILRGIIPGRADAPGVWEEVDALLDREWSLKNGRTMRISATFIDSGGHFTQEIYRQCAARAGRRIWPIKGVGGENVPYVRLSKQDGALLFLIGVDSGKEAIMYAADVEEPGPRYMHFPIDHQCGYDEEYFAGLISERLVPVRKNGRMVMRWEKIHERNEPLDMRDYALAAFRNFRWDLNGIERRLYRGGKPKPVPRHEAERRGDRHIISRGFDLD